MQLQCCTVSDICSVHAIQQHPELWFTQYSRGWAVFCTAISAVRVQCDYKCTARLIARAQIDFACSARVAVDAYAAIEWWNVLYILLWPPSYYSIIITLNRMNGFIYDCNYQIRYLYHSIWPKDSLLIKRLRFIVWWNTIRKIVS